MPTLYLDGRSFTVSTNATGAEQAPTTTAPARWAGPVGYPGTGAPSQGRSADEQYRNRWPIV